MKRFILSLFLACSAKAAEIRGIWVNPVTNSSLANVQAEITNKVNFLAAMKANIYLANLTEARWNTITNGTSPDEIAEIIRIAAAKGISTYLWYAPWYVKSSSPALIAHPEWQSVRNTGVTNTASFCLLRPEVRANELGILTNAAIRFTGLTGVHLEEPGYAAISYCFCTYCTNYFMTNQGVDITLEDTAAINAQRTTYSAAGTNFVQLLRSNLLNINSALKLSSNTQSYNSDTSARIGNNWISWYTNGWIDWFTPQLYRTNGVVNGTLNSFSNEVKGAYAYLPSVTMVPGIGVGWSNPLQTNTVQEITNQIYITRTFPTAGWVLFRNEFIIDDFTNSIAATFIDESSGTTNLTKPRRPKIKGWR